MGLYSEKLPERETRVKRLPDPALDSTRRSDEARRIEYAPARVKSLLLHSMS